MQRKTVIFIADSLDNAHKFQQVLSKLDVDVAAGSSVQFKKLLAAHPSHDLVIYEARGDALGRWPRWRRRLPRKAPPPCSSS